MCPHTIHVALANEPVIAVQTIGSIAPDEVLFFQPLSYFSTKIYIVGTH